VKFNTSYLISFVTLYKHGNYPGAADALAVTPSAIHQNVDKLQKHFNEALYIKQGKHIAFTPLGDRLYKRANHILTELESLDSWTQTENDSQNHTLRILYKNVSIYQTTLMPFLSDFARTFPNIDLQITDHGRDADIYWDMSTNDETMLKDLTDMKQKNLVSMRHGIYASPKYLKKHGEPTSIRDLANHKIIGNTTNKPFNGLIIRSILNSKTKVNPIELDASIAASNSLEYLGTQGLGLFNSSPSLPITQELVQKKKLVPVMEKYWHKTQLRTYFQSTARNKAVVKKCVDFFYNNKETWDY